MNNFTNLALNKTLLTNLSKQGIKTPTPIQKLAIPEIISGKDVIAKAQTGTGKTLAFLLPIFQNFDTETRSIQGLILTPTRELALQITDEANKLAQDTDINVLAVFGGQDLSSQLKRLNNKVDLVIATPGRLLDHLRRKTIKLTGLKTMVLDEADQMLHIGFKEEVEMILKRTNHDKQLLCFSATLDSNVKKLAYKHMKKPIELSVEKESVTLDAIKQKVVIASDRLKQEALFKELDRTNPFLGIIFCRTKRRADKLEEEMIAKNYNCQKLHGDLSQSARERVMKAFREAKFQYLIATDVAARGLDITGVTHIYNYDIPESGENYIHRIGRTGRMGENGIAITFVSQRDFNSLRSIENEIRMSLKKETFSRTSDDSGSDRPRKSRNKLDSRKPKETRSPKNTRDARGQKNKRSRTTDSRDKRSEKRNSKASDTSDFSYKYSKSAGSKTSSKSTSKRGPKRKSRPKR